MVAQIDLGGLLAAASKLAPSAPFWHLGGTLAILGAAGKASGGPYSDFQRFRDDLGTHFEGFSGTEGRKSGFVFGFVSMSLLTPIFESKSGHLGLLKHGFHIQGIAKKTVRRSR